MLFFSHFEIYGIYLRYSFQNTCTRAHVCVNVCEFIGTNRTTVSNEIIRLISNSSRLIPECGELFRESSWFIFILFIEFQVFDSEILSQFFEFCFSGLFHIFSWRGKFFKFTIYVICRYVECDTKSEENKSRTKLSDNCEM